LSAGLIGVVVPPSPTARAAILPSGFQEQIVFTGLNQPTNIEFAPDGRVFVAEKGGVIKVFDGLADPVPSVFADLSDRTHNQWDRGMLGLAVSAAVSPPDVYVLYTYDAPPGQTAPYWNDNCNGVVGGANGGNCVVTARLSRVSAGGAEQVLIHDWCQQFPSHSIGDLHFGADGMLYVSGGDGASFSAVDYGQHGQPANPCGDPANEGGALRSQDARTSADAVGLSGTILRLDPATGLAAPGNPNLGSPDVNLRRIVALGLRNPFRFTLRPGTNEVWIGDVGWSTWEDIERLANPTAPMTNFGWPCYEGSGRMPSYDNANLPLCESLYSGAGQTAPFFTYNHANAIVPGEQCAAGGDSVSGLAFYPTGGPYPVAYHGSLFFADYSRGCIWAMNTGTRAVTAFVQQAAGPVDLAIGPGGELYYVDLGGTVRRIRYFPSNQPPIAHIVATPVTGQVPLTVGFDGSGSTDADPADQGRLTYQWDFLDDGTFDASGVTATHTYPSAGTFTARLRVTDTLGAVDEETVTIQPGNAAPVAVIDTPAAGTLWRVGETLSFSGHATDPQQGTLPASALSWQLRMQHCTTPSACHIHVVQTWTGAAGGSFVAPDHEYPSYLELALTATDAQGLSHTVVRRLDPRTVRLTFASNPAGVSLTVGSFTGAAPFTREVIQGSTNTVSAPATYTSGLQSYRFDRWSDGGAQAHVIVAPTVDTTYTATYRACVLILC
jgi:glucose/arabinose dehydrogenase